MKVRIPSPKSRGFLELDAASLVQHPQVVVAEAGGELGREQLFVGAPEDLALPAGP